MDKFDLAIIGAGPAGLACALYAARYKMRLLLLEKLPQPGGQILLSPDIDNYPGVPGPVSTMDFIDKLTGQITSLGVALTNDPISSVKLKDQLFLLEGKESAYSALTVVAACGAGPKRLDVPGEKEFTGKGVSYCATCDAPLFRNRDVAVIGGGDRAVEEAIYLCQYAKTVSLIHRRESLRASEILQEKARNNPKIKFVLDSVVEKICGSRFVESVQVRNLKDGSNNPLNCQGVFIFVGIEPNTACLQGTCDMEQGFIVTGQEMHTSVKGLFAAGDCRKKGLYQVINACSDGAIAAHSAHKYLLNL